MNARNGSTDDVSGSVMPTAEQLLAATAPPGHGGEKGGAKAGRGTPRKGIGDIPGITESPDARALRAAADAEPGVRSRSCLIRTDEPPVGVRVIVSIAVAYGLALHEVARRVRTRVATAAAELFEAAPDAVTVDVKVVWLDEPAAEDNHAH
ncbi:hypothetical protein LO772_25305 [Yinghuangia sp. ASG 101]|uniref:hypothetical protein n=1 Tax=Yinghuangia sp. ASG 101 TaxID=2896848 RepID=UPI001E6376E4|nr:hypothetical protein [Yinghuangia sp. ASG 101]UGQ10173.1 hypothetical protein LO772_25305 [Yinghuangia sp. ASG 101]